MTFKTIKQLEKEYDKAGKKCVDNAYNPEKDEWNKEHFNRCDGDIIAGKLDQTEEIVKMIEGLKKKEKVCMEKDEHDEQVLEHTNQIEMADKILTKIRGKE